MQMTSLDQYAAGRICVCTSSDRDHQFSEIYHWKVMNYMTCKIKCGVLWRSLEKGKIFCLQQSDIIAWKINNIESQLSMNPEKGVGIQSSNKSILYSSSKSLHCSPYFSGKNEAKFLDISSLTSVRSAISLNISKPNFCNYYKFPGYLQAQRTLQKT